MPATGFALLFRALLARSRSLERSEATLRESEARCRDFALTSSDWFWETDEQHRFSHLSDHIRAFGLDPQTRIGGDSGQPVVQRKVEGAAFLELARNTVARVEEVSKEEGPKIEISE